MRLRLCLYFLRQALGSMVKNRFVHFIGLGTTVISLVIFGSFLLLFANLNAWVEGWGHALSMSVYLEDGISQAKKDRIAASIKALPGAEIKRFISKEKALVDLRRALGSQAGLLGGLSNNPLPASFEVVFHKGKGERVNPEKTKAELEELGGVEEVQYSEEWFERLEGIVGMVRLAGWVIGGLFCLGVLFIVTNTIKLTIYARREEIEILKLVGATDWFVKIPFLLEGVIQGMLSGGVTLLTLFLGYLLLSERKLHFLNLATLNFDFLPSQYIFFILVLSLVLGFLGSLIALGRFFEA
jgi:cell division transport system permease protein